MTNNSIRSSRAYIRLSEFFYNCSKKNVDYSIAKILILKIGEFPDIYIEEIAYLAQTTPASVSKFCKKLGYNNFTEMKNDIAIEPHSQMFSNTNEIAKREGVNAAFKYFYDEEKRNLNQCYEIINKEQIGRIGANLKKCSKVAVLTNNYSFGVANLMRELLSSQGIIVFEVNRSAEDDVVKSIFSDVDMVFVISLSGTWVQERRQLLNETCNKKAQLVLITFQEANQYSEYFSEVISLEKYEDFFHSNYFSHKILQMICILLSTATNS